jgi:putative transposase
MPWDKPYHPPRNQRLDPSLYASAGRVVFFTLRSHRMQSPFSDHALSQAVVDALIDSARAGRCRLFTYCLMPDHLHYLISPEVDRICTLAFTDRYKSLSTNRSWTFGWQGRLWQPRNYDHVFRKEEDLVAIDMYIRSNPVRRGLVEEPDDWPWSGKVDALPL